ncbi:MAG: glutathione S-transferase family protein [Novosphingobium sp.]|uniref:glutathione S-transferase family protein n=1 Tax=Novosphingobium sp. TaxID=1874826 RepID=UPI0017EA754B|nr:glutathione S-transferase family protein [Novosphingobium sp.]
MPTLYDFSRAPSPRRARILLAEKGIAHDTVIVDLAVGEQLSDGYRSINPACTLPALKLDDGSVLPDNPAIAAWAEASQPEPALLGRTPLEKADVASWNAKIEHECFMAIAEAMRNTAPAMKDRALPGPSNYAQIPELATRGMARLNDFIARFERHMTGRDWVATGHFTQADITAAVALDFARVLRIDAYADHPAVAAWRARLAERPAFSL